MNVEYFVLLFILCSAYIKRNHFYYFLKGQHFSLTQESSLKPNNVVDWDVVDKLYTCIHCFVIGEQKMIKYYIKIIILAVLMT